MALVAALAALTGSVAVIVDRAAERRMEQDARVSLAAVADLKVHQISDWLRERIGDAYAIGRDPYFAQAAVQWLDAGAPAGDEAGRLESTLSNLITAYGYDGIVLVDQRGHSRLSIGASTSLSEEDRQRIGAVVARGELRIESTQVNGGAETHEVLDFICPLFAAMGHDYRARAALVLRIDVGSLLYPLVQEWPTMAASSAEAYIVGKHKAAAAYITGLRDLPQAALRRGLPAERRDEPALRAMEGFEGEMEAADYRGVRVIASVRNIDDMSWVLVAKIDRSEALAQVWGLRARVGAFAMLAFAVLCAAVLLVWRSFQRGRESEQARAQQELQESEDRYRQLFDSGNDGVMILRLDGRIVEVNKVSCEQLGRTRKEMLATNAAAINAPGSAERIPARIEQVRADGSGVFESVLVRADGSVFPADISVRLIIYEGAPALLATVRDVTERKRLADAERESARQIEGALMEAVSAMATVVEQRDPYTAGHQRKVASLATAIARQMGYPEERVRGLGLAASIIDIGKVSVPAEILGRPAALSEAELDLVKAHAEAGYAVLKDVRFPWPVAEFVLQHHERLDGSGYPRGLKGEAILPEARILAVADSVAAMASHRPYRSAVPLQAILEEMNRLRGTKYDAGVVEACLRLFRDKGYVLGA